MTQHKNTSEFENKQEADAITERANAVDEGSPIP